MANKILILNAHLPGPVREAARKVRLLTDPVSPSSDTVEKMRALHSAAKQHGLVTADNASKYTIPRGILNTHEIVRRRTGLELVPKSRRRLQGPIRE